MPKKRRYSDEQVREAVQNSTSIRQVLSKLGLNETGGNYTCIQLLFKKLNLDFSHFKRQGWNKGLSFPPKRPIEDYFNGIRITSHKLRLRLLKEGIFPKKCGRCHLSEWMGQEIPLELEHKDGNHSNNSLENLEIICPNCHAQTPTHAGKNIGKGRIRTDRHN